MSNKVHKQSDYLWQLSQFLNMESNTTVRNSDSQYYQTVGIKALSQNITICHYKLTGYYGLLPYHLTNHQLLLLDILSQHFLQKEIQLLQRNRLRSIRDYYFNHPLRQQCHTSTVGLARQLSQYYQLPIVISTNHFNWTKIDHEMGYLGYRQWAQQHLSVVIGPLKHRTFTKLVNGRQLLLHLQRQCKQLVPHFCQTIELLIRPNFLSSSHSQLGIDLYLGKPAPETLIQYRISISEEILN